MIKFNRIGNKPGIASVVMLAISMVANQLTTEATVAVANDRTDRLQLVAESTLAAHLHARQVQLAEQGLRRKSTPPSPRCARPARSKPGEIDAALATARMAETTDRLQKIKSLRASYSAGIDELAKAQRDRRRSRCPAIVTASSSRLASS